MKYFVLAYVLLLLTGCSPRQEALNIGAGTYLGYQPFFAVDHTNLTEVLPCPTCQARQHFIGQQAVVINRLPSTATVLRLIQAGEFDGAFLTLDEAILLNQQLPSEFCIVEALSLSVRANALAVRPNFNTEQAFTVGFQQSPFDKFLIQKAAEHLNWPAELFTTQYVAPKNHVAALMNGQVDALITFEPYLSQLKKAGARILMDSAELPREVLDVFVVTKKAYQQHTDWIHWVVYQLWPKGLALMFPHKTSAQITQETGILFFRPYDLPHDLPQQAPQLEKGLSQQELYELIERRATWLAEEDFHPIESCKESQAAGGHL